MVWNLVIGWKHGEIVWKYGEIVWKCSMEHGNSKEVQCGTRKLYGNIVEVGNSAEVLWK